MLQSPESRICPEQSRRRLLPTRSPAPSTQNNVQKKKKKEKKKSSFLRAGALNTVVSEVFVAHQGDADVLPQLVFGAVAWGPVWSFERRAGAAQGADRSRAFPVFPHGPLPRLRAPADRKSVV